MKEKGIATAVIAVIVIVVVAVVGTGAYFVLKGPEEGAPSGGEGGETPPGKVTGLSVTDLHDGKLNLTWNSATDDVTADHYNIYRDGTLLTTTTSTFYIDNGLTDNQQYNYQVSATDTSNNEGEKSASVSGTPTPTPTPTRWINPTAPNEQTKYLSGDFTDADGDGMTDVAELKYGFDPNDPGSFPTEPDEVVPPKVSIVQSGIGAEYEIAPGGIIIRWDNPEQGSYSLELYNGGQQIYYGGHPTGYAPVYYSEFNLNGTEVLVGRFGECGPDYQWVRDYPEFTIDLSTISFLEVGDPANRISYTFKDFPSEEEQAYRDFLTRVFPIMYYYLGPPAEAFNCVITNEGPDSDFMVVDGGRTFLSDTDFIPRLITHEFVHAWKGRYTITSDETWNYDPTLTGFEEATAEGMAFEIMHEYVRSYPNDPATIQLLDWKPYQYWSARTTFYDSINHIRWTGGGDFWTHTGSQVSRYSIAATTWQIMMKENPNAYNEMMQAYYDKINNDSTWRPNREDIVDIWTEVVPHINGINTTEYLNTVPVFQGHKLDTGVYILETRRPYGGSGDQQFCMTYVNKDGETWWGILKSEVEKYNLPDWVSWVPADDPYVYIDVQDEPFTIDIYNSLNEKINSFSKMTKYERADDGSPNGFGWIMVDEVAMENFSVGLYRETVTFDNYIGYDTGAREDFYFFGLDGLDQDQYNEYIIMIGVDGVTSGHITITIDGTEYTEPIINGAAIFRSDIWPFDMEAKIPIIISNDSGDVNTYHRTLIEAGTYHGYYQQQFIIVDRDFDGIEDAYGD